METTPQIPDSAQGEQTPSTEPKPLSYHQRYYQQHKTAIQAHNKQYYEDNKEQYKKLKKRWLKANPNKSKEYYINRKVKEQAVKLPEDQESPQAPAES